MNWFNQRRKSIYGLLGIALSIAVQYYGHTSIYVTMAVGVFAALGIHEVPNEPNELALVLQDIRDIFGTATFKPVAPTPVVNPEPAPTPGTSANVMPVEHWGNTA